MLERSHLQLLNALNQSGSVSSAAEALHVSQSALSHAIRKLENRFNLKIWERSGRNIKLTQAGEYLLQVAQAVLPRFEEAETALRAFSQGKKGKLRIGMECHPCYEWLMTVVPQYMQQWPQVDLDVIQQFRFDGLEALQNHSIDLLITSDPIQRDDLINKPVLDYELMLAVPMTSSSNPLPRYIKPRALATQNLISFPVEKARLDVFTRFLIPAGTEPASHQLVETIEVMLQLVANGRGICTLPDWLLDKYACEYGLQGISLGREGVHKTLYLVMREPDLAVDYIRGFSE